MQHLQPNSTLQGGKYKIEKVLGQGGFGITYLAEQVMLGRKVALKEFFFKEYCDRDENTSHITLGTQSNAETVQKFLQKFLKEARTISQLEHPNIVKIHDIFEENNTAYYVMDYIEGESLSDVVKREGVLPEVTAVEYIKEVASALGYIHSKSINHLDVKPANIMLRKSDNQVLLIDFGLSKQYDEIGSQTSSTPVGISQGYAPIEQYRAGGVSTFSPQTDIYSLGATLYWLVIGKTPPAADEILDEGMPALPASISEAVKNAITSAMQARKKDRPESVEKWLQILAVQQESKEEAVSNKATVKPTAPKPEPAAADESTMLITPSQPEPTPKKEEVVSTPSFNLDEYKISPALLKDVKETENKANLGNTECMFAIAIMYLRGEGKFQNIDQVYSWLNKCKANGDKRAVGLLERWEELKENYAQKRTPKTLQINKKPIEEKQTKNNSSQPKLKISNEYVIAIIISIVLSFGIVLIFRGEKEGTNKVATTPEVNKDISQICDSIVEESEYIIEESEQPKNGYYVETYSDGSKYEGNFKNGQYHGYGVYTWANVKIGYATKYEGNWENGVQHGQGTIYYKENRAGYFIKYTGNWVNGIREGRGTCYYKDGTSQTGIWKNGQLIKEDVSSNNVQKQTKDGTLRKQNQSSESATKKSSYTTNESYVDKVYEVADIQPSYPGGLDKLLVWLSRNIIYPASAQEQGIQGRVVVSFVVDKDGKAVEPRVVKSVDPALDAEAIRVVSVMPKWQPGRQDGKVVRVRFTLPITFRLP